MRWCSVGRFRPRSELRSRFVLLLKLGCVPHRGWLIRHSGIHRRLNAAWASALRIPVDDAYGLVHIPDNAGHHLSQDDPEEMDEYSLRVSYLCKAATKVYGNRCHAYGGIAPSRLTCSSYLDY
ncbi:YagK/YfjJ domain-containing protein [Pseudomonas sp. GG8]